MSKGIVLLREERTVSFKTEKGNTVTVVYTNEKKGIGKVFINDGLEEVAKGCIVIYPEPIKKVKSLDCARSKPTIKKGCIVVVISKERPIYNSEKVSEIILS